MKLTTLLLPSILVCCLTQAQPARSVYFELGGPGLASFNFDTRFSQKDDGLGGRIGVSGFTSGGDTRLYFPVQVNYLLGKDHRHFFEVGGGATIATVNDHSYDDPFSGSFGHLYFGYRLQPADGGFLFRAGVNPIFGKGYFIPYYAGISFGYTFGKYREEDRR